ncbi:MAG: hypothetical protein GY750_06535 [Lentisphaerae bacterium]|nr:hypothetical protein [Lentisphaerota bacterium]MCP4101066.1 hypothetical protein [Lentisphaerota bacterium]
MTVDQQTTKTVDKIKECINSLISKNAKSFLLLNLPDMSITPSAKDHADLKVLHALAIEHNRKLQAMANELKSKNPSISIHIFDVFSMMNEALANIEAYNAKYGTKITVTDRGFWDGGYTIFGKKKNKEALAEEVSNEVDKANTRNVTDSSLLGRLVSQSATLRTAYEVAKIYEMGYRPPMDADNYLFWDYVHPTRVIHEALGKIIIDYINQNYTPAH